MAQDYGGLAPLWGKVPPPGSNALSARRGPVRSAQLHGGDVAAGEEFLLRSSESCVEHVRFMSSEPAVSPPSATLGLGANQQFQATAMESSGDPLTAVSFSWSATGGSVTGDGL